MSGLEHLRVRLLGGLDVDGVAAKDIGTRKARTLVKVLALARGATVPADKVVEALWPGDDAPAKPLDQVGVLVSRLRAVIGTERLVRTDAGWALAVDWLDVVELEERVTEAAARLAAGNPGAARVAAAAALALVRGELLADEPDPVWAEPDRAAVARAVARARLVAAEAALVAGDPTDAAAVAEGALDHDRYDEAALRVLMRAHAAAGRPASALAAYARVREQLAEDLGVDPAPETEELHTAILLGGPSPDAPAPAPAPALVGRASELAALDRLLRRATDGEAVLAVVEGEAGIGKTALVSAWATGRTDALLVQGRCDELGRDLPLQPVLDGLQAHLRTLDPDEVAGVLGDAEPVLGPLLGRFSTGAAQPEPTTVADPAAGQARLFASLLAVLERAAGDRPAVVVTEDVHLAGASTLEWLRFAVRRGRRLLVLATQRPDGASLPAEVVQVGPLDLAAVAELVGDERAEDLHARSAGHPLFLLELATAAPGVLPVSVREAVSARVDGLGDAASTLRAAAILGAEVDVDLLAGVLGRSVTELLEHLDAGLRALVLTERGSALVFRHDLVREALVAGTNATRRSFVHREAAHVLDGRPTRDPMEVAWHARAGGDIATAARALVDAAATANSRCDVALAEQLLTEAIELDDGIGARLARARLRIAAWDPGGAEQDVARAVELGAGAAGLEVAAWVAYYQRDYERAHRYAEEAVVQSGDDGLRTSCLAMSGRVLHASGDLPGAEVRLVEAVDTAPASVRGLAQAWLGGLRVHQGRPEDGEPLVDRALVERRWLGHPFALHHGLMFRALALGMRGRIDAAFRAVDDMRTGAVAAGQQGERFLVISDSVESWLHRGAGALEEGQAANAAALERAGEELGVAVSEPRAAALLDALEGRLLGGDLDGAQRAAEAAVGVRTATGTMMWHHRQRYEVQRARLALALGAPEDALDLARPVIVDALERGTPRYGSQAVVAAARAQLALGQGVDHDALDAALSALDRCAALEAWRVTAELAAAAGSDRWWRDAERRAGALVANAGERGEGLRRHVGTAFTALGR